MKIIHKAMRGGKTTQLIEWLCADSSRKMVVIHAPERDRLIKHYELASDVGKRIIVATQGALLGTQGEVAVVTTYLTNH